MTGFFRITKLDFLTMKSQLTAYLSLVLIIIMFAVMGSPLIVVCVSSAWFVVLMSSNIFAIQEKITSIGYMARFLLVLKILYSEGISLSF